MKREVIIYFLFSIILISLFYQSFINMRSFTKEAITSQNGNIISVTLANLLPVINKTNTEINILFENIKKLPLSESNKKLYNDIMNSGDPPLLKYSKILNTLTGSDRDIDTNLVNVLVSKDSSSQSVIDTNEQITNAFSTIVNLHIDDNEYNSILQNTKISPIEKYNSLLYLVKNQTNFDHSQ